MKIILTSFFSLVGYNEFNPYFCILLLLFLFINKQLCVYFTQEKLISYLTQYLKSG